MRRASARHMAPYQRAPSGGDAGDAMIELNARRLGVAPQVAADYEAIREGAALVDLSARGRMRFTGAGARDALNGVLTCDVAPLAPGTGSYGAALSAKGKVLADVFVYAGRDSFLVEVPPGAWPGWTSMVGKYINPRLAARHDETASTGELGVFGPRGAAILAGAIGLPAAELELLSSFAHLDLSTEPVNVARIPDLGVEGFRVIGPRDRVAALRSTLIASGGREIGAEAAECARIEAGRPLWGLDMDESTLSQEANLDQLGAISYTKGCYTGQEIVARLHFRGHVNRRLVGLRVEGAAVPARGAELTTGDGTACGDVRSSGLSPRFGAIALAMVRREVEVGATLQLASPGGSTSAEVAGLPFGA
ncbi:MAG TPA: glycine cleavage T C-terminal barrel domain-containing protein [Gemmatimonadaceae bacterium]